MGIAWSDDWTVRQADCPVRDVDLADLELKEEEEVAVPLAQVLVER